MAIYSTLSSGSFTVLSVHFSPSSSERASYSPTCSPPPNAIHLSVLSAMRRGLNDFSTASSSGHTAPVLSTQRSGLGLPMGASGSPMVVFVVLLWKRSTVRRCGAYSVASLMDHQRVSSACSR